MSNVYSFSTSEFCNLKVLKTDIEGFFPSLKFCSFALLKYLIRLKKVLNSRKCENLALKFQVRKARIALNIFQHKNSNRSYNFSKLWSPAFLEIHSQFFKIRNSEKFTRKFAKSRKSSFKNPRVLEIDFKFPHFRKLKSKNPETVSSFFQVAGEFQSVTYSS